MDIAGPPLNLVVHFPISAMTASFRLMKSIGSRPSQVRGAAALVACVVALCAAMSPALAEIEVDIDDSGDYPAVTYRMTVTPAPQPVPVFAHRLETREIELVTGNAAPYYYRSLLAQAEVRKSIEEEFENADVVKDWSDPELLLADMPLEDVRRVLAMYEGDVADNLDVAVRRRQCDWQWQFEETRGNRHLNFSMAELQQARALIQYLRLRSRVAIADDDYAAALDVVRDQLRLCTDVARPPAAVCGLIGIAGAAVAHDSLRELIAAPGSPNLYWAMTALPDPFIAMRSPMQAEVNSGFRYFPVLIDAETAERSSDEWNRKYQQFWAAFKRFNEDDIAFADDQPVKRTHPLTKELLGAMFGVMGYRHAKEQLIADGMDPERVEAMPVGRVLLIYTARAYTFFADEFERVWLLPFADALEADFEDFVNRHHLLGQSPHREVIPVAAILLPSIRAARIADMRARRDWAALRVIEALRMHAAEKDGQLPTELDDVTCVPVPENPATGQPFDYVLDGDEATLELPHSDQVGIQRRYVIRIAVKGLP